MTGELSEVKVEQSFCWLKIYLGGLLHFCAKQSDITGFQSWLYEGKFCIEFTTKNGPIELEYASHQLWKNVLTELNKVLR